MIELQGDLLRDQALERLQDAHLRWLELTVLVIARVARTHAQLTADDVWEALPASVSITEPRAMGAAFRMAQRDGMICPTTSWAVSTRAVCHNRPVRVWASLVHR